MTHPVNLNAAFKRAEKTDFVANAREAWGDALPPWVLALAQAASAKSATEIAKRLDYSAAVVSSVCRNRYAGDLSRVEAKVRGVLMSETVDCPVLGDINRALCIDEQGKKFFGTSAVRTRLYRACPTCIHSLQRQKEEAAHG
jgi:hypothetical protein